MSPSSKNTALLILVAFLTLATSSCGGGGGILGGGKQDLKSPCVSSDAGPCSERAYPIGNLQYANARYS